MKQKNQLGKMQTAASYKRLLWGFSLGVVALLGIILYFSLSRTIITVTLQPQQTETSLSVHLADEMTASTMSSITIPGYLTNVEMTETKSIDLEGEGDAVPAAATGTVTIYNNWSQEQPLQATTRLLTPDGTLFRIRERVDVPAGGKVENVAVYADVEGANGNIEPTKFTIPGLWKDLQNQIYAESFEAMTGGLRQVTLLTQADVAAARTELIDTMLPQAAALLADDETVLEKHDVILSQAIAPVVQQTTTDPEVGTETGIYDLTITVQFVAALFDEDALRHLMEQQFISELSADEESATATTPLLEYSLEDFDLNQGTARLAVTYTSATVPRLSSPIFDRSEMVDKDRQEINSYFSHFDEVSDVNIKFSPFWVRRAPSLTDHIEIRIER